MALRANTVTDRDAREARAGQGVGDLHAVDGLYGMRVEEPPGPIVTGGNYVNQSSICQ